MNKWIAIIVLIMILMIGFVSTLRDRKKHLDCLTFSYEFLNNFREFSNSLFQKQFNAEKYQWLKMKSYRMQSLSGYFGIAHAYKPAGSNLLFNNYQIIINGVTEVKDIFQRMSGSFGGLSFEWEMLRESTGMIDDVLLSYIGFLENNSEHKLKAIKNPLIWFREGIQFIVTLPISLVYWSGIINYSIYNRFSNNILVKTITLAVGIIAFISSIITIVTGYVPFLKYLDGYINTFK